MSVSLSVVVCTRDREDRLRRCVQALLDVEAPQRWELIIVNNNSSDGTGEFLRSIPAKYNNVECKVLLESRCGLGIARNTGWRAARGQIIGFTDDDCYVARDYVSCLVNCFNEDPNLGFLGGRILLYDPNDLKTTTLDSDQRFVLPPRTFIPTGTVQGANLAFRRDVLECIGGFDEKFGHGALFACDDIDAVAAAIWKGFSGAYDPRPTVYHHHGRKTAEERARIMQIYAAGRGAYFAKYILRKESRAKYIRAWSQRIGGEMRGAAGSIWHGRRPSLKISAIEIRAAARYLKSLH